MKMTAIPIVIGALSTVTKGLIQELEILEIRGREETIQTTLLRSARILRRVLETCRDCCHSNVNERPSALADVNYSLGVNSDNDIIIINNNKGIWNGRLRL